MTQYWLEIVSNSFECYVSIPECGHFRFFSQQIPPSFGNISVRALISFPCKCHANIDPQLWTSGQFMWKKKWWH